MSETQTDADTTEAEPKPEPRESATADLDVIRTDTTEYAEVPGTVDPRNLIERDRDESTTTVWTAGFHPADVVAAHIDAAILALDEIPEGQRPEGFDQWYYALMMSAIKATRIRGAINSEP